ncbi:MAG: hypothetical protein K2Y29_10465 [Beijerinckiaceae bacterium]|nr:hypothetical protein [Beijerinckiaceae bacterium]
MSIKGVLVSLVMAAIAAPALAQAPLSSSKQMRFIVPFPPGGTLDVLARTVAGELGPAMGESIVVENRPGASGAIGAEAVARATPDARTLVIVSNTIVTLPALRNDLPFDVFKDFAPVILLGTTPTVITVHPSVKARNYAEFVAAVNGAGGGMSFNSPGIASPPHLAGELLARSANLKLVHVPYRGTQPAVTDLVAGHVPVMMAPLNAVLPMIEAKQLFPIALTDGARTKYLPDVPTLKELGVNAPPVSSWFAVLTTGGSPPAAVQRLNTEIAKILRDPKVVKTLDVQTFETSPGSIEDLAKLMREDAAINAKIVSEAKITMQ